jgi:hypothetical protein
MRGSARRAMHGHHGRQRSTAMSDHLLQTPVLIFAFMMLSFLVILGPIAAGDLIRSRKD